MIRKSIFNSIVIGLLSGIVVGAGFIGRGMEKEFSLELLAFEMSGARDGFYLTTDVLSLLRYSLLTLPSVMYAVYSGCRIYRSFCVGSVYIWSRCSKRNSWIAKEMSIVFIQQLIFYVCMLTSTIVVTIIKWPVKKTFYGLVLLCLHLLLQSMWTFSLCNAFVILAVLKEGNTAFVTVIGLYYILLVSIAFASVGDLQSLAVNIVHINPIAHLILCWQNIDNYIPLHGTKMIEVSLVESVAYMFILCFATSLILFRIIKNKNVIIHDLDSEMI